MNNYHICEIGRSKNSVVYKGRLKKSIEYLAIKSCEKIHKQKVMNEVRILENLSHENIVKYYEWHKTRNHLWLILEYCPGGDILTLIDQDRSLPEQVIMNFGLNIMDGLHYLHTNGIIYADLKPSNILFNEYGVLKLCDFGLARLITDSQSEETKKGTPYYMAPELFEEGGVYSYYSDLWSFGCVLYELAVGAPPFISNTFKDLKEQILTGETPVIENCSACFNDLISGLLQKDPSKRIGWEEVLWHEFWEGKRMIKFKLPNHECYEQYLKARGVIQRSNSHIRDNKMYEAKDSVRASLNGKEDFVIKSRDQVFNFGENWDLEEKVEEAKIVHQRSNSAALQTPANKNTFKPQPIEQLMIHNSDISVKPIINGHEDLLSWFDQSIAKWDAESLSEEVNSPELENHLSEVYSLLSSNANTSMKISYLAYIESLIQDFPLANKLINSAFVQLFLKLFTNKTPDLRNRLCSIFGQMLRHATIIDSDLPRSAVAEAFIEIIKEEQRPESTVRKNAFAALGEYLFYAATQMDEEDYDEAWEIDGNIVSILIQEISKGSDLQCKFLATRTVENITAQSRNCGVIFAKNEMACALSEVVMKPLDEELKLSALAALSHIIRLNPKLLKDFFGIVSGKCIYQTLADGEERAQQALISILCFGMQQKETFEINIPILINLLESPGIVIRGKMLLFFMFLLKMSTGYLNDLVKTKFFGTIDRLLKDSYKYVQCCLHHFLDVLTEKIMQIIRMAVEGSFLHFSVLPQIFNSVSARLKLPFPAFIKVVSGLLVKDIPETNQIILEILENLATKSKQLKSFSDLIITVLFPSLIEALNRNIDTRFRCLKIFSDIAIQFLFDSEVYDPEKVSKYTTKLMHDLLVTRIFPIYADLLEDAEPVPLLSIKLLGYILERCPEYVVVVKSHGLLGKLLAHFSAGDAKLSMHLVQIVRKLIDSDVVPLEELIEHNIVEKINSVLIHVVTQEWCIEITLDILYHLLLTLSSKYREKSHQQIYPLSLNLVICTELLQSEDDNISEKSAHCLLLILQLFGTYITQNATVEQGKALLQILNYNKSGLQKVCIKILKGVVENITIPGIMEKIIMMRRHENEEIAKIAVEIQAIVRSKGKI